MAVFFLWPMLQAVALAFQTPTGQFSLQPVQTMAADVSFQPAIRNTLLLAVVIVPTQLVLALIMALLLTAGLRFSGVFLYLWAIPLGISDLAAGIVWFAIFTQNGYVNSVLQAVGLGQVTFLSYETPVALFFIAVLAETWRATAIVMIILVAGLQVIPKDYAEAAEVFGANAWQRLRYVTLPLLLPSLQVALILRTILAFQVFAVVIALAGRNLPVLAGQAYTWYGDNHNVGVAAAYSLLIMIFSLLITSFYLRALRVRDEQARMV
ncbi:MAG: sugar ABC transporter permease [Chloroflexi bacterium]|nr:sugar ABC transporter permease [Chloroflexota bacterium]